RSSAPLFLSSSAALRSLPPFPTRRSSDLLTTTSGAAANVLRWLEQWHQTEWPHLRVYFTSVTDHWATLAVNGPDSRQVLQALCEDRKSTRLNSSHVSISYAVFCLKKKKEN